MKEFFLYLALSIPLFSAEKQHDIVVYGGTSGGIIAAIQAAKSERSVVLVSPTAYLGGLTTSGLGWTDLGSDAILGGLSREFYTRVYQHYQNDEAWRWEKRAQFGNKGQGAPALNPKTRLASVFEPSVATAIFDDMLEEHGVTVVTARLDLKNGVVMEGKRIQKIRTEDGREFAGKIFIDATYEGDLLPEAGVSFTTGRESNATYNETVNGIQSMRAVKNQLPDGIDPYVKPGDPSSGLLPGVNPDAGGEDGEGDHRLQAYCFRMCLTDVPGNRVAFEKPDGFDEADYELLFRAIEAGQRNGFTKFSLMPNRKTDSNNTGGISNNPVGINYGKDWNWTTLDHDERLALAKEHEHWQRGLMWTLQNHPRVPEKIREEYSKWGLAKDEFTDNNHWPHQLYVREARRMVSDFVMTENHCMRKQTAPESIGLAAYTMDSHSVQRHVKNGMVKNEGDVQRRIPGPYPVSYRAIVPKKGECENLLVPWSLSASHMAFGSIRMEPVFMILSQSAATAADIAIDKGVPVQNVPYEILETRLLADGQKLVVSKAK
ncbi:FAD-dependent oxidoreductase [Haloferula sp.]|uniref:FAD-dependent oxidoreductase n=1 Tax=Haloferula sp. TaxID=2497595 RepID=UPI003C753CC1